MFLPIQNVISWQNAAMKFQLANFRLA